MWVRVWVRVCVWVGMDARERTSGNRHVLCGEQDDGQSALLPESEPFLHQRPVAHVL